MVLAQLKCIFLVFYFSSRWRKAELLFLLSTTIALNREKFVLMHNTFKSEEKRKMFPIVCTIVSENDARE
jgi:hypothetical protein